MLSPHTSSSEIKISQLDSYINREEVKINEIYQHSNDLCDDNHSDFEPEGKIWKSFYEENCFFFLYDSLYMHRIVGSLERNSDTWDFM